MKPEAKDIVVKVASATMIITGIVISGLNIKESEITKAKKIYRKNFPECAVCNYYSKRVANDVHHVVPVHVDRSLSTNQDNFITLCDRHHWWVGHCKNFKYWNTNVRATAFALSTTWKNSSVMATNSIIKE